MSEGEAQVYRRHMSFTVDGAGRRGRALVGCSRTG
jgi:hypothetical protein